MCMNVNDVKRKKNSMFFSRQIKNYIFNVDVVPNFYCHTLRFQLSNDEVQLEISNYNIYFDSISCRRLSLSETEEWKR